MTLGRSFLLTVGLFVVRFVFVTYGQLAWSFLLMVEVWFGLLCLRWKIGSVLLRTVNPPPSPPEIDLVFLLTRPPA